MKRPSFQFYPGDWLRDTALRTCSIGARGLWIDMICLMHEGNPYGYLKVGNKVILPDNLCRIVGATLDEVEGWLSELSDAGVCSKDESGCIYCRRMVRDEEVRRRRAAGGKLGGNPALTGKPSVGEKVEGYDKDNLSGNLSDERDDKRNPTPSSSSSSSSSKHTIRAQNESVNTDSSVPGQNCPHQKIVDLYHQILPELPPVRDITPSRQKSLRARWRSHKRFQNMKFWSDFFELVSTSDFLMGRAKDWQADFDFMIRASKFQKIIEGGYQNGAA